MCKTYINSGPILSLVSSPRPAIIFDSGVHLKIIEDHFICSKEILQAKGFINQVIVCEEGHFCINVSRHCITGQAMVRDFSRIEGYASPNQPAVIVNRNRNEAYVPLRTPLQPTEWPRSSRYPQAVYLKLAHMIW